MPAEPRHPVAIHGAPEFVTEWLEGVDRAWVSRPRRRTDQPRGG